ncbi:hypothetical protein [Bacillus massilinigeriensis]|nr:hypothetical protein [Bacillus mediterraneensis]
MDRKKMMMTTVALGTAYLLRNRESREKIKNQFKSMSRSNKNN